MKFHLPMAAIALLFASAVQANSTPHDLSAGNFSQDWSNPALITVDDDWSGVPSIEGFRGDNLTGGTGTDPQTLIAADDPGVIDVTANQLGTITNTFNTGGVAEFATTDAVVTLQGSGTADAPYLQVYLNTTGRQNVQISYVLRDLDGSADNSTQQFALHYRVGNSGAWTNIPAGYVPDASSGPSLATLVTPVAATLPAAAENQPLVQLRIMTTNAAGNDELTGVDNISVTSAAIPPLSASITPTNVSVFGGSDGSATATASGGVPGYSFAWSNGATTTTVNNLAAGTYSVTVTDANAATANATATIAQPPPAPTVTIPTQTNVSVFGGSDGSATATASGGTTPYTFAWSNGATTTTANNLAAGTYTVTVTDANSAFGTASTTITQPAALVATIPSQINVAINGQSTGSATAAASGGVPGYSFAWSNGATTTTANNLAAGTYTVTVTDANSAFATASTTITQPTALVATISSQTNVAINGQSTGSATVSASGGVPGYSFLWSNGATTATANNLAAGNYTVTVTDANSALATASTTITQPAALVATIPSQINVAINGQSTGSATAAASGGVPGYSFVWSNGATTATANNLAAGTYTVTVTDANAASANATATITQPAALVATISSQTNVAINGQSTGSATVSALGGVPGYSFVWSNGATTATANNLAAGTYTVTVTDANAANANASVTITQPTALVVSIANVVGESFPGAANGSASVTASGGVPPYTYLWSNGGTTATISGLAAGSYQVVVTDANGATASLATPAIVTVLGTSPPTFIPVNSPWMILLLLSVIGIIATRHHRAG